MSDRALKYNSMHESLGIEFSSFDRQSRSSSQSNQNNRFVKNIRMWLSDENGYLLLLWFGIHAAIFTTQFLAMKYNPNYTTVRELMGITLPIAKACATVLNFDFGLLLFGVSYRFLTFVSNVRILRKVMNIDGFRTNHKVLGLTILFFSLMHTFAHCINFIQVSFKTGLPFPYLWFGNATNATGNIVLILLLLISCSSISYIRKRYYNISTGAHQLFIVIYILLMFHGAFCFIKADSDPKCGTGPLFWAYCLPSMIIFSLDKIISFLYCKEPVEIYAVIEKPCETLEIRFNHTSLMGKSKFNFRPGQYVRLICPEISWLEHHAFSITSAPQDDYMSVHLSVRGDWTSKLKDLFSGTSVAGKAFTNSGLEVRTKSIMPKLYVDGPFLSPSDEALYYKTLILVGGGIGVTPFASILKSACKASQNGQKNKIYFIWISKSANNFDWFNDTLSQVESLDEQNLIDISLYWTLKKVTPSLCYGVAHAMSTNARDPITELRKAKTFFGRPDWNHCLTKIEELHKNERIGVFACGPKKMVTSLHQHVKRRSQSRTKFEFHKEIF